MSEMLHDYEFGGDTEEGQSARPALLSGSSELVSDPIDETIEELAALTAA